MSSASTMLEMMGLRGSSAPPPGLRWRSNTFFICLTVGTGAFVDLFLYGMIVPVLPFLLKDRIDLPDSQIQSTISYLLAIYAAASCTISPIAGILVDKFSKSRQLPFLLGLTLLLLSTILLALGRSVAILAIARFLQGASGGVVWTIGGAIVVETVGQENLGKTMGVMFSFCAVAGLFSPMVGGLLYAKTGYTGVFGVGLALIVFDFILRVLMVETRVAARYDSPEPDASRDSGNTQEDTETTPLIPNGSVAPDRFRLSKPVNRFTRTVPVLMLLRDTALITAIWIGFMQALLIGSFDATVPLVASEQFDFNSLKAGLLFLPLGGADFFFGPVFGWCVDRYGTRPAAFLGFTWLIPTLILLRLPTESDLVDKLETSRLIALYAGLLAANGVGLASIGSPGIVEAGNVVEKYYKANRDLFEQAPYAQLYGINNMVWGAGLTLGPLIAGFLREKIGYGNMNLVLACLCALTAILSAIFIGEREEGDDDVTSGCDN